jgi:hypothetical protein
MVDRLVGGWTSRSAEVGERSRIQEPKSLAGRE